MAFTPRATNLHKPKEKTYDLSDTKALNAGQPVRFKGALHDRKVFPPSKFGRRRRDFAPFQKNPPDVVPEKVEKTNRPKFKRWHKFFLSQLSHRIEGLNGFQFDLDDGVNKDTGNDTPARHPDQADFEDALGELADFLQVGVAPTNPKQISWPLSGLHTFQLTYTNVGSSHSTVSFFLTLHFEADEQYCMVTNCTVILTLNMVLTPGTGGGGAGGYSSSSYLATSSSSL